MTQRTSVWIVEQKLNGAKDWHLVELFAFIDKARADELCEKEISRGMLSRVRRYYRVASKRRKK